MKTNADFLHVRGSEIVNGRGNVVRLSGFCLGGWMNLDETLRFAFATACYLECSCPRLLSNFEVWTKTRSTG